jgi:hypothetical protein
MFFHLIEFLHGKKTVIFGLIHLTNAFLSLQGLYSADVATYIAGILTIIGGGADYSTTKILGVTRRK